MHLNWNLDWSYIDTLSSGYKEPSHKNLQYEYLSVVLCDWFNFLFIASREIFNFIFSRISTVKTCTISGVQCLQKCVNHNNYTRARTEKAIIVGKWAKTTREIMTSLIILADKCHWIDRYQLFVADGTRASSHKHARRGMVFIRTIPRATFRVEEIACRYNLIIVSTTNRVIYTKSLEF